ncbi:MAG: hypothetical protein KDD19_16665, partial [Phaeodactylibacter sp.]|nr:hypothetical protein [Phaeodactylibacter sp.]
MNAGNVYKPFLVLFLAFLFINATSSGILNANKRPEAVPLMDKVTFRVDMTGLAVNPAGMYLASDFASTIGLTNWAQLPMCNIGGGLWEISFCGIPPGTYQYKFLNGPNGWEFDGFGGPCTNPADNNNRFVTVTGGMQLAGPFVLSSCTMTNNAGGADVTPPVITGPVPANTTVTCGNPLPAAMPLSASDGCDANCTLFTGMPVDNTSGLNACGLGAIIRTWTATDCAGNTATATQTITLIDNTPPTITGPAPGPITVGCAALPPAVPLPASDACDATVTSTGPPVDNTSGLNACGVGVIQRTWTVADCSGNSTSVTQAITLQDNAPPVITGAIPANITVVCGAIPPAVPLAATDDCDASVVSTGPPVDNTSGLNACGVGVIQRTWTVADCSGNSTSVTQSITVQDATPPMITGPAPANITVSCGAIPPAGPLPASDNCDASVSSTGPPVDDLNGLGPCGVGTVLRTWTVADCSGNSTSVTQTITVSDAQLPTIFNAPADITLNCGSPLPPASPLVASDNCDPTVTTTGPPAEDNSGLGACGLGVIQRIWSVADCSGNTAIAIQSITLADAAPPVITQPVPANVVVDCNGALPPAVPLAASDDCDPGAFQTEVPLDDLSGLDACGTGVIQRSWTVSDCSGNTTVATQTITVVDLEAPVILDAVPADVTVSCLNMPAAAPLAAFDLCDGNIFSTGIPVDDLSGLGACGAGEVVRTWTVTDCAGNTTSASQIITLVDAGPPTIDDPVPANITVNCIDLPPAQPLAASDDCDGNVVSTGMPVDDLAGLNACGVGAVMRTWTVSDCSGNTASVFQVITVEDNTPPVLAVPADGTFNCDAIPSAAAAVTSATDDCSTPTIVYDGETIVGGGCPYEIHRTWTATDACGNAVSQTQVITVQDTVAPVFVNSPQDMTVCEGSLPPLASLNWADNCDGAGTVNGTESTNGLNNPEIITRAWAFTDACGNTVNHTQTITVVAAPAVNAGEDRSICEGSQAALSATVTGGADTTFWSSMGDGTFDGTSSPDALYTPGPNDLAIGQAALVFSARPAAANCPAATDTVVVNFVPLPSADAGPGQEITCDVPSVTIGTPGVVGMLYEWSGPGIDDNNRNNPTPVVGAPGQYILNVTAAGTACSVFDTVLVSTDTGFPVAAAGGNQEVNCIQTEVTLDGSGSSVGADFTLSWSGPGIDGSNQNQISPVVTQPGMYTLTVSNTANGCTATAEVSVLVDTLPPVADAGSPQLIDCNNPIVTLGAGNSSAGTDIIYQWLAPNGAPLGSGAMQAVTQEGIYSLVVRDTTNGCSDMAIAEVLIDTLPPVANAGPDRTLTCTQPSITLNAGGTSVGGQLAFEWRRDGTPVGVDSTLDISVPGIYTLLVVNTSNGCSRTDEVLVTENTSAPVADAGTGGLLTCTDNCLVLGGANTSAGPNFTYEWMGAAHAVANANAPAPEVCAPDTYTLVVTNTDNGCTATDAVAVAEDASLPTAVARSNDTLSCEVAEVVLSGAGSTSGTEIEYQWRDDSGQLISTGLEATVASPGLYSFTVINTQTQCQSSTVAQAFIDTLPPLADAGAGLALDCAHPSVMLGSGAVPQPGVQYQWQDANGNILGTGLNQPASVPGLYTLLVVDTGNGCSATDEVFVTDNVIYPLVDAGANRTLNCINGTAFLDGSGSSAGGGFAYSWSGPGFSSTEVSPQINTGGTYVLSVTNTSNSCSATDTVAVALDTIAPIADAGPDGLLTCAVTDVQLDGAGSDQGAGLAYAWTDVSGAVVGNGLALPVNTPGIYQLSVTNTLNGCTAADEVVVEIDT